jgi:hypothetical protein
LCYKNYMIENRNKIRWMWDWNFDDDWRFKSCSSLWCWWRQHGPPETLLSGHITAQCHNPERPRHKYMRNDMDMSYAYMHACMHAYIHIYIHARAVCKVRRLTLLLRVGTLWRCGDGLFIEVPPLESDALLTNLHPLFENVLQTVDHFEISSLEAPFSWLENLKNRMGRDLNRILCSAWKCGSVVPH